MVRELLDGTRLFVIHDFMSATACDAFIARGEQTGFEAATITTAAGFVMNKDVRDNARAIVDDPALAVEWWRDAAALLPARIDDWQATGFNERFRYYRYDPGQKFAPHYDGAFSRPSGERSHLTFLVYLNDDFRGGETRFFTDAGTPRLTVRPARGSALVFVHRQLHEGAAVIEGRKYVLRTDVMYAPVASEPREPGIEQGGRGVGQHAHS